MKASEIDRYILKTAYMPCSTIGGSSRVRWNEVWLIIMSFEEATYCTYAPFSPGLLRRREYMKASRIDSKLALMIDSKLERFTNIYSLRQSIIHYYHFTIKLYSVPVLENVSHNIRWYYESF